MGGSFVEISRCFPGACTVGSEVGVFLGLLLCGFWGSLLVGEDMQVTSWKDAL